MRFLRIEMLLESQSLVDVDKIAHVAEHEPGTRLFLGSRPFDVPHTLTELWTVMDGLRRSDNAEERTAGYHVL